MAANDKDQDILLDIPLDDVDAKSVDKAGRDAEDEGVAALKARVEDARKQREADRLGREEAERRTAAAIEETTRARREAAAARAEMSTGRLETIAAAIDSITREAEMGQAKLEKAALEGDYKALAAAQREISRAEARLVALEGSKEAITAEIEASKRQPVDQQRDNRQNRDPVDSYISSLTPRSSVWMNAHRDLIQPNGAPKGELVAAHTLAVSRGVQPDSDQYFQFIERKLSEFANDNQEQNVEDGVTIDLTPKRVPVAAPVSRESASEQSSPTRVRLTREQLEAASFMDMTPAEYAKSLLDPNTKALLNRSRH